MELEIYLNVLSGYFTKWGDGSCDLNPLANITKQEVYILAKYLSVPDCIINKKPSAELWQGQNDEDDLGITYKQIDSYILNGTCGDNNVDSLISRKHKQIVHKLKEIPVFNNE